MSDTIIQVENLSKQYRLGEVSTGTLAHDLNRWWHRVRGRPDPYVKVTQANARDRRPASSSSRDQDYVWALRDVSFEVRRGEVLGVIGRNGAGKSTLLKIMSRITAPTSGEVRLDGRIAALLEVGTGFHPELTGRENIFLNGSILGMTKAEIRSKLDEIVAFSGCERYIDTPVKRYSSGMVVRLGFAVAAHLEPEILIVDEVLAVGDAEFQKKCLGKMQDVARHGRTVLFVSHNMGAVERLCSRALLMDSGGMVAEGSPSMCIGRYLGDASSTRSEAFTNHSEGDVVIKQFGLVYEGTPAKDVLLTGGELAFDLGLEARRELRRLAVHIGLYTQSGMLVCLCRSDSAVELNVGPGALRIRCVLGSLPLAGGLYYANLSLFEASQTLYSGVRQISFEVVSGLDCTGGSRKISALLAPAARWEQLDPFVW